MYDSNNVHILFYVVFGVLGIYAGKIVAWLNIRLPQNKKVFSKEFVEENNKGLEKNYICIITMIIIYCGLLRKFGLASTFMKNLDLIKYMVLTPMLVASFLIDLKHRILPNRLNMTMFEIGLIFAFVYGINNLNISIDMLLGMLAGAGIFGGIAALGNIIAGKESMGLGDVKFMGAVGAFFGVSMIVQISLLAFFLGAIFSIILMIIRNLILKKSDEYMPFGPFLVTSCIIGIFLPTNTILSVFMLLCNKIVLMIS